jgi:MoaA/NifB/PqqE/SkfB family radical SAM enzyme
MANLYTPLKIFHFKEKIDSLPIDNPEILAPLHIRIKPTNICNHNCYYCAYRAENLQLGQDMVKTDSIPKEKMLEITDDIIEMGVKAVTFSGGGEPLIYPHLADVLRKLIDSPVRFATLTNGSRLTGEIAELFALRGTWVRVSMDAWDDSSYADYRRVANGEFTNVLNNMAVFKRMRGPCKLGVSFIIDDRNPPHVYEAVLKFRDIGVDSVKVSPCIIDNDGKENNAFHRPFFNNVVEQIGLAKKDLENENFEIFDAYHELDETFTKDYTWCPYCQILPVIGADQNIYTCQDKAYNLESGFLGSIKSQSLREFWSSLKNIFFQINPSKDCLHHCVANNKNNMIIEYLSADLDHLGFV